MSESLDERVIDIRTRRAWRPRADRTAAVFALQALLTAIASLIGAFCFQKMTGG